MLQLTSSVLLLLLLYPGKLSRGLPAPPDAAAAAGCCVSPNSHAATAGAPSAALLSTLAGATAAAAAAVDAAENVSELQARPCCSTPTPAAPARALVLPGQAVPVLLAVLSQGLQLDPSHTPAAAVGAAAAAARAAR